MESLVTQCQTQLTNSAEAQAYLRRRGIPEEVWGHYRLGYYNHNPVSKYFERIVFPITSPVGEVIAIQCRTIRADVQPKYLHTSYDKKSYLYGFYESLELCKQGKMPVLFEGNMEVPILYHHDIPAMAVMGSSATIQQFLLLSIVTDKVFLWADNDAPGKKAREQWTKLAISAGLEVYYPTYDGGDLSEYVTTGGVFEDHPGIKQYYEISNH